VVLSDRDRFLKGAAPAQVISLCLVSCRCQPSVAFRSFAFVCGFRSRFSRCAAVCFVFAHRWLSEKNAWLGFRVASTLATLVQTAYQSMTVFGPGELVSIFLSRLTLHIILTLLNSLLIVLS